MTIKNAPEATAIASGAGQSQTKKIYVYIIPVVDQKVKKYGGSRPLLQLVKFINFWTSRRGICRTLKK